MHGAGMCAVFEHHAVLPFKIFQKRNGGQQFANATVWGRRHFLDHFDPGTLDIQVAPLGDDAHDRGDTGPQGGRHQIGRGKGTPLTLVVLGRVRDEDRARFRVHGPAFQVTDVFNCESGHSCLCCGLSGIIRFMNSANSGTVNAVSPWDGLYIIPFLISALRTGAPD